jgi:hypothetical protein
LGSGGDRPLEVFVVLEAGLASKLGSEVDGGIGRAGVEGDVLGLDAGGHGAVDALLDFIDRARAAIADLVLEVVAANNVGVEEGDEATLVEDVAVLAARAGGDALERPGSVEGIAFGVLGLAFEKDLGVTVVGGEVVTGEDFRGGVAFVFDGCLGTSLADLVARGGNDFEGVTSYGIGLEADGVRFTAVKIAIVEEGVGTGGDEVPAVLRVYATFFGSGELEPRCHGALAVDDKHGAVGGNGNFGADFAVGGDDLDGDSVVIDAAAVRSLDLESVGAEHVGVEGDDLGFGVINESR